jgi:hypothetical protein
MTVYLIKDTMTGRYYNGTNPRFPMMGGTKRTAVRFHDRMAATDVLRQFPSFVLADVVEVSK